MTDIHNLLEDKSQYNIDSLYETVKYYKDWSNGVQFSWTSNFVNDIETVWLRQDEYIENI